jgi:hypothetical protein
MQRQLLQERDVKKELNMENYVGLVSYLEDPFNLFVRLDELENEDIDLVYFFVYSIGKKENYVMGYLLKIRRRFFNRISL